MAQHALAGIASRPWRALDTFLRWHDARPRASFGDARGWIWLALVAATFVWMSNPLVFIPTYYLSFNEASVMDQGRAGPDAPVPARAPAPVALGGVPRR